MRADTSQRRHEYGGVAFVQNQQRYRPACVQLISLSIATPPAPAANVSAVPSPASSIIALTTPTSHQQNFICSVCWYVGSHDLMSSPEPVPRTPVAEIVRAGASLKQSQPSNLTNSPSKPKVQLATVVCVPLRRIHREVMRSLTFHHSRAAL
jgi:hypothetical protein